MTQASDLLSFISIAMFVITLLLVAP